MFFLKELPSREILERYHTRFPEMQVDMVQDALQLMRRASILIRRLDEYFAGHDFSQLRFLICVVIDREQDREQLTAGEIAARLDVSKPVMARTLHSLKESGFVEIAVDTQDKRAKRIGLTSSGVQKLNAILPGYYAVIQDFMTNEGKSHE